MAAELRLNVGLDLNYFKRQLPQLSAAAAGYKLPLQVKFDRKSLANELRLLGNQLSKRRDFRVQVNDTAIKKARENAEKLVNYLNSNLKGAKYVVDVEFREKGRPAAVGTSGVGASSGGRRPSFLDNPVYKAELQRISKFNAQALAKAAASLPQGRNRQEVERLLEAYNKQKPTGPARKGALDAIRGLLAQGAVQRSTGVQASLTPPSGMLTSASGKPRFKLAGASDPSKVSSVFPRVGSMVGQPGSGSFQFAPRALPPAKTGPVDTSVLQGQRFRSPSIPPARGGYGGGIFGGGNRGGGFSGGPGMPSMPALPGSGAIRELGGEFANATKQVLLFGTAYKGLAFLMDFPAQVGSAVAALQSFNNTLSAITPNAEAAAQANDFILGIVDKYNVPLQSARDGFTKLYASMSPAGFSGEDIEELFLGVSQAAATFGMSADKVDRVNYAFAQMASKGQIMSEELKGQLGDVLPGAMGIFAEAAGLEGPDAIQKFSKALEDGAFKGENMNKLLKNVSTVLQEEFGPGAEGAARTFQGLTNRMQNSMKLLYEAFEPLAVDFLNGVVVPLTGGIKTLTDGFTAFFTQTAAKTKDGAAFAAVLEDLRPSFEGIKENVIEVTTVLKPMFAALGLVAQKLIEIAGNPVVGYLAKMLAILLPLNAAYRAIMTTIGLVKAKMLLLKTAIVLTNAKAATGAARFKALRVAITMMGGASGKTAIKVRALGLALKSALGSTVIGAILVGIGLLIEKMISLRAKMDDVKRAAQEASASIASMGRAEAVQTRNQAEADLVTLRGMRARGGPTQASMVAASDEERAALERAGVTATKFKDRANGGGEAQGTTVSAIARALEQTQGRLTSSRDRVIALDQESAEEKARLKKELAEISLDADADGSGSKDAPMSADALAINEALNAKRREGNELAVAHLELAAELQSIKEKGLSATDEQAELDDARTKHLLKIKKIREQNDKDAQQALKEQEASRFTLKGILLEAQFASGAISEEEYKIQKFLLEQEATRRRILELPQLSDEEKQGVINQLPTAPPEEKGDIANWIEKTEEDLNNFEGMATEVADGIASEFGTAFSDILQGTTSISEGLSNAFANISKMFADMVMQMLAKWAMLQVMKSLFPGMADGGVVNASGGGGGVSLVPQMANGGIVKGPTMAMVGEGRFNEAVVPLPNGKAIPVDMGKGGGGNVNSSVVVNINNGGGSESSTKGSQGNQLAKGIEGAVKDVIMREMRPGGMIASGR